MLIRLARQGYIRQYGDFTYIFGKVDAFDQAYRDAEAFTCFITREPQDKEDILNRIFNVYPDADKAEVRADFDNFINPLIASGVILAGETPEELNQQERHFTYDCDDPKTKRDEKILTKEEADFLPQSVLGEYFASHPTLFTLQIDLTQACTERCVHCYIPEYNPIYLPFEKIADVIDQFREMGGMSITLSGGECMMHPDFGKIIEHVRSRDCIVGVLSNLTLCDDEKISILQNADATVQVSLYSMSPKVHDGITHRQGSWVKTVDAIIRLRKADVPVRISCPTMKQNYRDYTDVIKFAESLKMDAQTDFIMIAQSNGDCSNLDCRLDIPQTRELLRDVILKSVPMNSEYFSPDKKNDMLSPEEWAERPVCGAGIDSMCLAPNGEYYPCTGFSGMVLGNCYHDRLEEVWLRSPNILKIRAVRGRDFPKCKACKDRDYCSICMCRNFNETGDMFKLADHFCQIAAVNHEVVDEKQREMARNAIQ